MSKQGTSYLEYSKEILQSSIEVAQRYGFPKGDKYILGRKQIDMH